METTGKLFVFSSQLVLICLLILSVALVCEQTSNVANFKVHTSSDRKSDLRSGLEDLKVHRVKRDTQQSDECVRQKDKYANDKRLETTHVFANETNFNLAMAWAGEDDDGTLVVLTSEMDFFSAQSTLWRSSDHGRTWNNISSKVDNAVFRKSDGLQRHPSKPKWLYLVSYHDYLYKTEDGGETWTKVNLPATVENELIFHTDTGYEDHILLIISGHKLVKTTDNFKTYDTIKDKLVHTAYWGTVASQTQHSVFICYGADTSGISFFNFDPDYFELQRSDQSSAWQTIKKNVADFGIQGDFLYATVFQTDHPTADTERRMIVSSDGGKSWNEAQLPTVTSDRFFSVCDMTQHSIFIHVDNPGDTGHGTLYTSSRRGIIYSESLLHHLYPNFNEITDFYKVESMKGTYIASQMSTDNSIHSMITFDLGGEWKPMSLPDGTNCSDASKTCSLQIHNLYSIHQGVVAHPPHSTKDAVGLILVNAHAAQNLQVTHPDVYVTSDGGYTWKKALDGPHSYIIADSGGLIVAVPLSTPTPNTIKFSTDEGRCWHEYVFTNETVHHTGLLTEPGGKSLTVAIWGYRDADKKWTVSVIDFADVLPNMCQKSDYEDWTAHSILRKEENKDVAGCLLGSRVSFKRLKADSWCHNGYTYAVTTTEYPCSCTFEDFDCDYGYYRPDGKEVCEKQPDFKGPEIDVCIRGHEERIISEGYRKIPGDVCNEDTGFKPSSSQLINLTQVCDYRILPNALSNSIPENDVAKSSQALVVTIVAIALILMTVVVAYFGYKMVLLRRHKVVYRYSKLNQGEDKDLDEEIERTLTDQHMHTFGNMSDEEELPPPPPPQANGHAPKDKVVKTGYHDESDDDMLE